MNYREIGSGLKNILIPAFPPEDGGPVAAEFPSRAVAPPNKIKRGPIYPGVPSSPTAVTAVNVYPHLDPGFGWLVCSLIL